jgi:hypothetical protein
LENKYSRPAAEENKIPFLYMRHCDLILKPFTIGIRICNFNTDGSIEWNP